MLETSEDQARRWLSRIETPVIVLCAYCARMRNASGEWHRAVLDGRQIPVATPGALVSHGCCPDCLDRELARCQRAELPG